MTKQDAWNHGDQENKDYAAAYKQRSNPNRGSQIGNTFGDHLRDHRYKELPEHLQGGLLSEQSVYHNNLLIGALASLGVGLALLAFPKSSKTSTTTVPV